MENNFANWDNSETSNSNEYPFDFNSSLNLKSTSPFQNDNDQNDNNDDPFAESAVNGVFNTIIGNDNHHFYHHINGGVGVFGLTNFYQVSPMSMTNTNFSSSANNQLSSSSSSYNPFLVELNDNSNVAVECNNDNSWAAFDADNFADFDSHFAEFEPVTTENSETGPVTTQTFVATTQTIEISTAPPPPPYEPPKRDFVLGTSTQINNLLPAMDALELDEVEDEFYSLRDDSNEMNSLTEDKTRNAENTEVPDDDDDDFASADER